MTAELTREGYQLTQQDLVRIRDFYFNSVLKQIDQLGRDTEPEPEVIHALLEDIHQKENIPLEGRIKEAIFKEVLFEIIGFGPIEPALRDPEVTEIMVNGPQNVYLERGGKLTKSNIRFKDNDHIIRIIEKIVYPLGRRIDEESPMVDARLPDGSRVNAVVPPVAIDGPSVTIRKFSKEKLKVENLIAFGSITPTAADFLKACVEARLNIIISGGTGSGKTTLLNILSGFIPHTDRIVTIEDSAELQLQQDHVVRLETQPPSLDNTGEITIRDLVRNSLRMRPDRIVVGEVRGGETIDMLQAMNTGHDGSLTTLHANTPRDALSRLETMAMMSGMDLPIRVIREQIASAVDLIVQQSRFTDGSRKITHITEVAGMEGDTIVMTDVFKFKQTGVENEKILGALRPTGIRPLFSEHLQAAGFEMTPEMFGIGQS